MSVTHLFVSSIPDSGDTTLVQPSNWNASHVVSITNTDVNNAAGIVESKLSLNYPTHASVTIGTANGLSLVAQALSLGTASAGVTGALSGTDWSTFNAKQAALSFPLSAANGGTGIANGAGATLTLPNLAISLAGGVAAGVYTLPATSTTLAGLSIANIFTLTNTFGALRVGTPYNSNIQNTLTMPAATWTVVATGTVGTGAGGYTITGSGTTFLTDYKVGDAIGIDTLSGTPTPNYHGYITAIASDTSMTTDRYWNAVSGSAHRRLSPVYQIVTSANVPILTIDSFGQFAFGGVNQNYLGVPTNTSINQLIFTSTSTSYNAITWGVGRGYLKYDNTAFSAFRNVCIFYGNSGSLMVREDSQYIYLQAQLGIIQIPVTDGRQLTLGGFTTQTLAPVLFYDNTAATAVIRNVLQLETQSTGTAAAGLGVGLLLSLETATAATMQSAGRVYSEWVTAANTTRAAKTSITAFDYGAERIGFQVEGSGTATKIGFYAVATIARPTNAIAAAAFVANTSGIVDDSATFGGYTLGQVVQALQNIGILT